jgi:MFS family permease
VSGPHSTGIRRGSGLAVAWLVLGVPVGALIGWLARISDRAGDRAYGSYLLALAAVSLALGLGLLMTRPRWLFVASLTGSAAWLVAAGTAVAVADFTADKAWGGGLTGVVAVVTAGLAIGPLRRTYEADT